MGTFGPGSTPQIQPTVRHIEKPNPDSQRRKKQDDPGKDKPKPPPRGEDRVELEHEASGPAAHIDPVKRPTEPKHIDFSA